jgi:hypothetical protein
MGKMFTAVTIARLVERKQVSFESTLSSFLPEYPSADPRDRVTVRHLLTMSSGIPDMFRVPRFWAEIGTIKSSKDYVEVLRGLAVAVCARHTMGVQQFHFFCWERSSSESRGVSFMRWSSRRSSVLSTWQTQAIESTRR